MVIKSSADIRSLLDALSSSDGTRREAAVARLAVIGKRATDRLLSAYGSSASGTGKVGILRALEAIADPRALPLACRALRDSGDVAVAAAAVLGPLLNAPEPATAVAALDALVEAALDPSRERRIRVAAYNALEDLPARMRAQVSEALTIDVTDVAREGRALEALFADAVDGRLPDEPKALRDAVLARGPDAPLASLQTLVDVVRARERATREPAARAAWQQVRGTAHQALALRGSRVAVYDLRETVEAADAPLPPSFLSAMRAVGDATCVDALAAAFARAPETDLWWRHQLAAALRAVARREGITKRHASMKRALARWPRAAAALV